MRINLLHIMWACWFIGVIGSLLFISSFPLGLLFYVPWIVVVLIMMSPLAPSGYLGVGRNKE